MGLRKGFPEKGQSKLVPEKVVRMGEHWWGEGNYISRVWTRQMPLNWRAGAETGTLGVGERVLSHW